MKITLKAPSGFMTAELGGDDSGIVTANRSQAGAWELWVVEPHGDMVSLKSTNGFYLCAEGTGGGDVHANRSQQGSWELFKPSGKFTEGAKITLTCVDNHSKLGVEPNGERRVSAANNLGVTFTVGIIEGEERLPRLTASKMGFKDPSGKRVFLKGVSAFMHYEKWLREGPEAIRPLLQQVVDLGANCIRVFGMAHYIPVNAGRPPFKPQDFGDRYFDEIPAFCALAAEYDLYVYWSVFPDANLINVGDTKAFMNRVVGKLKEVSNTIGELTNEQDAHSFNQIDPSSVDRPSGIAFTSGSYGDIGGPQPKPWDFCDYHTPRRYPTHIKDSCVVDHPNYGQGFGIALGEPDRYGTGGNMDKDQARQSAGASRETAIMHVFHSAQGRESQTYDGVTLDIAKAFFSAFGPA